MQNFSVYPLTLKFKDKLFEKEYFKQYVQNIEKVSRIGLIVSAFLFAITTNMDLYLPHQDFRIVISLRFICIVVILLAYFVLTYSKKRLEYHQMVLCFLFFVLCSMYILLYSFCTDENSLIYSGSMIILIFFGYNVSGLRFVYAFVINIYLIIGYSITVLINIYPDHMQNINVSVTYLFSSSVLSSYIAYVVEQNRRKIYFQQFHLNESKLKLQQSRDEIQETLENVKTLKGLIPICAHCKKIRDDKGYWNQLESYVSKYSDASFSHGICPDCTEELYKDEDWYNDYKKK